MFLLHMDMSLKKTKKYLYLIIGAIIIVAAMSFAIYLHTHIAKTATITQQIVSEYSQNAFDYIDPNQAFTISYTQQLKLRKDYLQRYFSPWTGEHTYESLQEIKKTEFSISNSAELIKSYGINYRKHSILWYKNIIADMDLNTFPNLNMRGIVVHNTYLRGLPTVDPAFDNPKDIGEGYPFNYLQSSILVKGTPIHVYHISKNGQWCLIATDYYFGWIKTNDLAFVSNSFVESWMQDQFVVPLKDNISAYDDDFNYRFSTRIGALYPLAKITPHYYKVLTVTVNPDNRYARIVAANLSNKDVTLFPLLLSTENIAFMIDQMQDHPYGWGDLYGYRDCSSTTRDLFGTFGIWLPRTSSEQVDSKQAIHLGGMNDAKKTQIIINKGIPFLTLIHNPGHILLYIGHRGKQIYVFHDMWKMYTRVLSGKPGQAIVGQPVITPLSFGSQYHNIPWSFLDNTDKILNLMPLSALR